MIRLFHCLLLYLPLSWLPSYFFTPLLSYNPYHLLFNPLSYQDNLIDDDYSDQDLADEFEARGPIYHPISTHARTWPDGTPFFESEKYLSRPNNTNTSTERRIKLKFKLKPNPIPSRTPSPPTHTTTTITASEPAPVQPPKKIKLIFKPTPTLRPAVTLPPKVTKITKRPQKPARKPAREPTRRSPRLKEAAKKAKAQEAKPVKPSPPLPPPSSHRRGPGDEGRSACVEEEGRRRGGKRVKRC